MLEFRGVLADNFRTFPEKSQNVTMARKSQISNCYSRDFTVEKFESLQSRRINRYMVIYTSRL